MIPYLYLISFVYSGIWSPLFLPNTLLIFDLLGCQWYLEFTVYNGYLIYI